MIKSTNTKHKLLGLDNDTRTQMTTVWERAFALRKDPDSHPSHLRCDLHLSRFGGHSV